MAIVEASDDAIISETLDGIITSWNPGAQRLCGYRPREVLGHPRSIIIPTDRQDESAATLERLRRGERIEHFETVRRRKDGRLIDVSISMSPLRDGSGAVVGASGPGPDQGATFHFTLPLADTVEAPPVPGAGARDR